ncbi:MAG: 4Fe-4S dicluster domain-containing protein [Melioribacteraceae bacterium]|nr:4Fe-4S dicluster domain-containing protein [Melioribacteraceae bacterium]
MQESVTENSKQKRNIQVADRFVTLAGRLPIEIEPDLCKECGLCVEACPPKVLRISNNLNVMGYHPVEYIGRGCTSCGICFYVCPEPGAITIHKKVR